MPKRKEIFKPTKGDKIWFMFNDIPVEVTVVETPLYYGPNGYDGVWKVNMPGVIGDMPVWPRRVFRTRTECLVFHIQDKQEDIEHVTQILQRAKEELKRVKKLYAKWTKMLEAANA